jgi:hypothetical protein
MFRSTESKCEIGLKSLVHIRKIEKDEMELLLTKQSKKKEICDLIEVAEAEINNYHGL